MRGKDIIEYWYFLMILLLVFLLAELLIFFDFSSSLEILNFAVLFIVTVISSFIPKFYILERKQQASRLTKAYYDLIRMKDRRISELRKEKDIAVRTAIRGEKRRKTAK